MFKFVTDKWLKEAVVAEEDHDISAGFDPTVSELAAAVTSEVTDGGSTYKVPLTTIVEITPHDKSDFLEFAWVYGFQVIVKKGSYKAGDTVIYVPIDSLLPKWLEDELFPYTKDANGNLVPPKITLHNHRVRQIKIRGYASQGMLINPADVARKVNPEYLKSEQDLAAILGITKYEPPQPGFAQTQGKRKNCNKNHEHPLFHKYNGLDNIKWFPSLFKEGEEVVIQEKLHGTNARASVLPFMANTLLKKVKKLFGLAPKVEKCYGSNNVDISAATAYRGFYGEDIYGTCFNALNVFEKIKEGEIFYGEIIGPGIQKNYYYGLKEHRFVVFDAKSLQPDGKFKWLTPEEVESVCKERGFEYVPVLYRGPYNKELAYSLTKGNSAYSPKQKVREGIVIKAAKQYDTGGNKKALKWVSEDYLSDNSNTDFH